MPFFFQVIAGQKKGLLYDALRASLYVCSLFFAAIVGIRKTLYRLGLKRRYRPQAFVISIGNIVAGGTGKTPFTILLAQKLKEIPIAILTRGYKSKAESSNRPTVIDQPKADPGDVGDEACVLARKLPYALIIVNKNRTQSAKLAQELGARVLILDDGMQHLALERDLEIVVIDAENPFGYGYLLPRGLLREPPSALLRADLIVLNHSKGRAVEAEIRKFSSAPIIKIQMAFEGIYSASGTEQELARCKVGIFCGIGKPEAFHKLVESLGFTVVAHRFLADHEAMGEIALEQFARECRALHAQALLCTEKDIVKLSAVQVSILPLFWVNVQLQITEGEAYCSLEALLKPASSPKK